MHDLTCYLWAVISAPLRRVERGKGTRFLGHTLEKKELKSTFLKNGQILPYNYC